MSRAILDKLSQEYRFGDVVKLKSGGMAVTICSHPYTKGIVGGSVQPYFVRCTWLNKFGDLREAEFDIALIQHYIPDELKAMLRAVEDAA